MSDTEVTDPQSSATPVEVPREDPVQEALVSVTIDIVFPDKSRLTKVLPLVACSTYENSKATMVNGGIIYFSIREHLFAERTLSCSFWWEALIAVGFDCKYFAAARLRDLCVYLWDPEEATWKPQKLHMPDAIKSMRWEGDTVLLVCVDGHTYRIAQEKYWLTGRLYWVLRKQAWVKQ
jgi:hypothetical protein